MIRVNKSFHFQAETAPRITTRDYSSQSPLGRTMANLKSEEFKNYSTWSGVFLLLSSLKYQIHFTWKKIKKIQQTVLHIVIFAPGV